MESAGTQTYAIAVTTHHNAETLGNLRKPIETYRNSWKLLVFVIAVTISQLKPGERPLVIVTHDECSFDANDGRHQRWIHADHTPLLKKGKGQTIIVSGFATGLGFLQASQQLSSADLSHIWVAGDPSRTDQSLEREHVYTATTTLECGKGIWWTGQHLTQQTLYAAIPVFEAQFPGCEALFLFDNARSHSAFAPDALRASEMNLFGGGEQAYLRDTKFHYPEYPHRVVKQSMVDEMGCQKGLRKVLIERGLWRNGLRLQCRDETKRTPRNTTGPAPLKSNCIIRGGTCCARAIMSSEPDFHSQKSQVEELILQRGHSVLLYPKFHCELNFIEYMWGRAKYYTRKNCSYNLIGLRQTVPAALASVSSSFCTKVYNKVHRMMDAYREGEAYGTEKFNHLVQHVFRSHRRISVQNI